MPLPIRIAGFLIAAGRFGSAAAYQPDTVKAVTVTPGAQLHRKNVAAGS